MRIIFLLFFSCFVSYGQQLNVSTLRVTNIIMLPPINLVAGATNYYLFIGQSNARGYDPALSLVQPFNNSMWTMGVSGASQELQTPISSDICTNFNPCVEAVKETPCSGFANEMHALVGNSTRDSTIGTWGIGAQPYASLKKGGTSTDYVRSMSSVSNWFTRVSGSRTVPALLCVHGESDSGSSTYCSDIAQWQQDYETDIKAVTSQSGTIPMFHTQVQQGDYPTGMLTGYETNKTKTVLVGPKYAYDYQPSGTHLQNYSYTVLGELYAKAVYKVLVLGQVWSPLRPVSISTAGAVISITFTGRVGNVVFDTTTVSNPGNYGFEYQGNGDGRTISSVAITDAVNGIVQVTLSGSAGTSGGERIAYAYTGAPYGPITGGCRGCLRDSDTVVGRSGTNLWNWCVHFVKPLNWTSP